MKTIARNVVLLPTDGVQDMAIQLSRGVQSFSDLTLGYVSVLPHISLYQTAYPATSHDEVCNALRKAVHDVPFFTFHVTMGEINPWGPDFIFWDVEPSEELQRIHERIVTALNPLRQGAVTEGHKQFLQRHLTPDVRRENDSIQKYGTPFAIDTFRPHVTLAHGKGEKDTQRAVALLLERLPSRSFRCKIETVALGTVGPFGVFPQALHQYPLVNP